MMPEQRAFVDGLIALAPAATLLPATVLSREQRAFVAELVALAQAPATAGGPTKAERAFVEQFVVLARTVLPTGDPADEFNTRVANRWQEITWRVQGAVAARFADLDGNQHRFIRTLEDTPSLLRPLAKERDELTHSRLLAWALSRPGDLGRALRSAFVELIGLERPLDGWLVRAESVLGPSCRVDVDIVVPGRWRCLVEVKVDADERDGQLDDYRTHLDACCATLNIDGDLVFVTLDGREGSCGAEHHALSFDELLRRWLPIAAGAEPDALFLRLWLASIAQGLCGIGQPGPVATWSFAHRVAMLRFLEDAPEKA
jgi:hypothetical protein